MTGPFDGILTDVTMRHLILVSLMMLGMPACLPKVEVFPAIDTVDADPALDDFRREWYTKHLRAMSESRLVDEPGEMYRFLWLRSFDHPIAVRVSCTEKTCRLTGVRTSGKGGYEPGSIAERRTRTLSAPEVTTFQGMLTRMDFWRQRQPRTDVIVNPDGTESVLVGTDGAQWVLEGRRGQAYHLWDVWSPEANGPAAAFRELCLFLIRMSGLAVRQDQIY